MALILFLVLQVLRFCNWQISMKMGVLSSKRKWLLHIALMVQVVMNIETCKTTVQALFFYHMQLSQWFLSHFCAAWFFHCKATQDIINRPIQSHLFMSTLYNCITKVAHNFVLGMPFSMQIMRFVRVKAFHFHNEWQRPVQKWSKICVAKVESTK